MDEAGCLHSELLQSAVLRKLTIIGDYKLVRNPAPKGNGEWELYDIMQDPAEVHDLGKRQPELVSKLIQAYEEYEKNNNVIPVPDGYNPAVQLQKNAQLNTDH